MNGIAPFQPKRRRLKLSGRKKHQTEDGAMHEGSIVTTVLLNDRLEPVQHTSATPVKADEVISVDPRGTAALFNCVCEDATARDRT